MVATALTGRDRVGERAVVAATAAAARAGERLAWLDALRGPLALLVVAHHGGQPYGPGGDWPVLEAARAPALGGFFAVNAAFFMGLFFLIAGYVLPGACDRKGSRAVLRDRLRRLGLPLLVFGLAAFGPITFVEYRAEGGKRPFWAFFLRDYLPGGIELGHLWFVAHLLVATAAYALWRRLRGEPRTAPASGGAPAAPPGHRALLIFALALAAATFAVRLRYPVDRWERLLGVLPTEIAHLPQYLALFVAGLAAARHDWFRRLPTATGLVWLRIGLAAAALRYAYALVPDGWLPPLLAKGGSDWRSLVWSTWEAIICVGLCVGLLVLARERLSHPGRGTRGSGWLGPLSANAYGVYVLHVWVLVPIQFALAGLALPPLAKFAVVCLVGLPLSVAAAALARRSPALRRML